MLEYYFRGLDVSSLSDQEFAMKVAHLLKIRQMERGDSIKQSKSNIY
jgi:hypothetical protein